MIERGNQLLALVMGAGKTLTALATIETLHRMGEVSCGLVIVPNTLKYQWYDEITDKTGAPVQIIDGDLANKQFQLKHATRFRYNVINPDVFSTKNGTSMVHYFLDGKIQFVVLDEATVIKSFKAKRSRAIKAFARDLPYRFALSGQPVENRPEELFSIMEFVDPSVLGDFKMFDRTFILRDNYGRPKRYRNLDVLKRAMAPVMYRKSRKDIEQYLPKIITTHVTVDLPAVSRRLYDFVVSDTLAVLEMMSPSGGFDLAAHYGDDDDTESGKFKGEIMSRVLAMRMICDHPALLMTSASQFDDPESSKGSRYASSLKAEGLITDALLAEDAKLKTTVELVDEILSEHPQNRVVVFSFFKPMLAMLGRAIQKQKHRVAYITGDVDAHGRAQALDAFKKQTRVLLSSDAGQYGVDLPHVNYLISYDLPWSAGAYAQRVARIDRISSVWPHVNVISVLTQGTIEERQYEMLEQKRLVAEAFIDGRHRDTKGGFTLSLDTLRRFLQEH